MVGQAESDSESGAIEFLVAILLYTLPIAFVQMTGCCGETWQAGIFCVITILVQQAIFLAWHLEFLVGFAQMYGLSCRKPSTKHGAVDVDCVAGSTFAPTYIVPVSKLELPFP